MATDALAPLCNQIINSYGIAYVRLTGLYHTRKSNSATCTYAVSMSRDHKMYITFCAPQSKSARFVFNKFINLNVNEDDDSVMR